MGCLCPILFKSNSKNQNQETQISEKDQDEKKTPIFEEIPSKEIQDSKAIPIENLHISHTVNLKDFKMHKILGKGGFGKVFLVEKIDAGKLFAMKILNKKYLRQKNQKENTQTERFILSKIVNPFIIQLFYAFQTPGQLYLVTEFAQGGELFFHLRKVYRFQEDQVIFYAAQIALALEELHQNGIIYRDLKPENILLDSKGNIKICDFGLSKVNINLDEKAKTICGTFEYLAPEVLMGIPYDKSADWWSLGVLMYEMLTGFLPLQRNDMVLTCQTQKVELKESPYINEVTYNFIAQLLEFDPKKRLEAASQFKTHQYFENINWKEVYELKVEPPFQPRVYEKTDVRNFDNIFTEEKVKESVEQRSISSFEVYSNFTYVNEKKGELKE